MPAQAAKSKDFDLLPALRKEHPRVDFDKFIALDNNDYSSYELAKEFDISQAMAWRIQQKISDIKQTLTHFKDNKLNYLSTIQLQTLQLQAKIIEYYLQDSKFDELKPKERIMLLDATNRIAGTLEDKQITIINVKGNLNINQINLGADEQALLQLKAVDMVKSHKTLSLQAVTLDADVTETDGGL